MRAFISYSHKDAEFLTQLHDHLATLHRQGILVTWTDRAIPAGGVIDDHVDGQMDQAELYLLLVSSAFIASDYCIEKEFARALERQKAGEAKIVPIIIRDCDWKIPALQRFKALPEDGKPVDGRHWHSRDEGFRNVAEGLRALIEDGSQPESTIARLRNAKAETPKFKPDERHVTEEQRAILRRIADEVVDRLVVRKSRSPDEVVKKAKGRFFGIVWKQFNEQFGTKKHGLQSLLREQFDEARQWFLQYRASKDGNYKRANPQKYRNTLTRTIYTLAGKLGWSDKELHAFAAEKVGYERTVDGLSSLGNTQLEHVRDRVRYEHTKRKVRSGQSKARGEANRDEPLLPAAKELLGLVLNHPVPEQRGLTWILREGPGTPLDAYFIPNTTAAGSAACMRKSAFRPAVDQLVRLGYMMPLETDEDQTVAVYELNTTARGPAGAIAFRQGLHPNAALIDIRNALDDTIGRNPPETAGDNVASIVEHAFVDSAVYFYEDRFTQAFPGVRGVVHFNDPAQVIERLSLLLRNPLEFRQSSQDRSTASSQNPIWWWRGHGNLQITKFRHLTANDILMNWDELRIRKAVAHNSGQYYQCFVYLECDPMERTGLYEYEDGYIEEQTSRYGYFNEPYGLFKGHMIKETEREDGAAVIDGKVTDVTGCTDPRTRYITPYNLVIAAQQSPINNSEFDTVFDAMMRGMLAGTFSVEGLAQAVCRLPKKTMRGE